MNTDNNHTGKNMRTLECVCESKFQDQRYGPRMRTMNPFKNGYRCTVCRREHTSSK